jgi:aspartyl-tRNA synthetase
MRSMKSMKAMKAKAMKAKSKIAKGKRAKASVWLGRKEKTSSGLKKSDLMKSKTGKIVSKKQHAAGKKAYMFIAGWTTAVRTARHQLGIQGFEAIKKGSALYELAMHIYEWPMFVEVKV